MKKVNKKYLAAAIITGGITALPLVRPVSAAEDNTASQNVDVKLTASQSAISFTITNSAITMDIPANSNTAQNVTSLGVKNNSTSLPIYVKNVKVASSETGYENKPYTSDFSAFDIDSGKWGLAITKDASSIDLSGSGYTGNKTDDNIAANATKTYSLAGKSSTFGTAITTATKIGELTVTVATK